MGFLFSTAVVSVVTVSYYRDITDLYSSDAVYIPPGPTKTERVNYVGHVRQT